MKRLISIFVVLLLVMGLIGTASAGGDDIVKLSWLVPTFDVNLSMDLPVIAELGRRMNVEIEFRNVAGDDFQTKFNTMIASAKDMADLVSTDKDSLALYGRDLFVNFNDHEDQFTNYFAVLDRVNCRDRVEMDDGSVYGAARFTDEPGMWYGLFMRYDILKENGIAIPNTLDELTDTFAKLKELYPDSSPMTGRWGLDNNISFWLYWFRTGSGMYYKADEDRFVYGPTMDEFKQAIEYLHMMWEKGYLDHETLTQTDEEFYSKLYTGKAFGMSDYFGAETNCNVNSVANNPDYYMCAIPLPEINGVRGYTKIDSYVNTGEMLAISNTCENIDKACELVNYFYTEEGANLMCWGIEGETYEISEDGMKHRTSNIITGNNPDGQVTERETGCRIGNVAKYWIEAVDVENYSGAQREGKLLYNELGVGEPISPLLHFTEDQTIYRKDLSSELSTYRSETVAAFITGEKDLAEWDEFLATLQSIGYEELEALYTEVYGK